MSFNIIGTGRAAPSFVLTNEKISEIVDTNDEWITSRTGIRERHIATDETLCSLSSAAAKDALKQSGLLPTQLDLIICATMEADDQTPSLACMVQREISATCPAFDLNAACTGFLYAMEVAASFMDSGRAEHILIIAAEMVSKHVDWTDRATCVLFGDGAGAAVLKKGDGYLASHLSATGNDTFLNIPGKNGTSPYSTLPKRAPVLSMAGSDVFKFAVHAMSNDIRTVLEQSGLQIADIKKFIPHQANIRIIRTAMKNLGLVEDQVAIGVDRYGNTSSASIPLLLSELFDQQELNPGDIIVLAAFGGGLTSGACIIKV